MKYQEVIPALEGAFPEFCVQNQREWPLLWQNEDPLTWPIFDHFAAFAVDAINQVSDESLRGKCVDFLELVCSDPDPTLAEMVRDCLVASGRLDAQPLSDLGPATRSLLEGVGVLKLRVLPFSTENIKRREGDE